MPEAKVTDWQARITPLDARVSATSNEPKINVIGYGADQVVTLDLSAALQTSEVLNPSEVSRTLWQWAAVGEDNVDVDVSSKMPAAISVGPTYINQRIAALDRTRYYRLEVTFGPVGNRRMRSTVIHCP